MPTAVSFFVCVIRIGPRDAAGRQDRAEEAVVLAVELRASRCARRPPAAASAVTRWALRAVGCAAAAVTRRPPKLWPTRWICRSGRARRTRREDRGHTVRRPCRRASSSGSRWRSSAIRRGAASTLKPASPRSRRRRRSRRRHRRAAAGAGRPRVETAPRRLSLLEQRVGARRSKKSVEPSSSCALVGIEQRADACRRTPRARPGSSSSSGTSASRVRRGSARASASSAPSRTGSRSAPRGALRIAAASARRSRWPRRRRGSAPARRTSCDGQNISTPRMRRARRPAPSASRDLRAKFCEERRRRARAPRPCRCSSRAR